MAGTGQAMAGEYRRIMIAASLMVVGVQLKLSSRDKRA
jgi:hypothetical protein